MSEDKKTCPTSIGGQAVIEGVMMRGPKEIAIAVRTPSGKIEIDKKPVQSLTKRYRIFKIPVLRGIIAFFESMIVGVKSLMFSAEFFDLEEEEEVPSKFDLLLDKIFGDKIQEALIYFSVIIAIAFGIGLFIMLPAVLAGFINRFISHGILATIVEGIFRISIFVLYIVLISRMKDIQRVFEYHGAEHKSIFCYESGEELTVENVKKHARLHPRCGTSFLLIVMVVSIILFSFISWDNIWTRLGYRLLLLPLVAGVSYEVIKFAGRSRSVVAKIISIPGMYLQRLTTREPYDSQIEVAIEALKHVMPENREEDKW